MPSKSNQDATPGPWRCRCGKGGMLEDGGGGKEKILSQKNGKEKEKERKT